MPPEIVPELCVKDLQHLLIEYHSDTIGNRERRSIFRLDEVGIEHKADSVRETFWKEVVKDKRLIKTISEDLRQKGVSDVDIDLLWEHAEQYGFPNFDAWGGGVNSVFLQVHHRKALKDGGTNSADNFIIVVNMPKELNSHEPLHEYDNPLIYLYKHKNVEEDGIIISQKLKDPEDIPVRLSTVFVADEENIRNNNPNRVLYYGGTSASSMYVGRVNSHVRGAIDKISKIYDRIAKKYHKKQKLSEKVSKTDVVRMTQATRVD